MSTNPPPLIPVACPPPPAPKSGIPLPLIIIGVLVLAVVGIAMLAGLLAPLLSRAKKKADLAVAMNNAKALVIAMNDFSSEYGGFPDRE